MVDYIFGASVKNNNSIDNQHPQETLKYIVDLLPHRLLLFLRSGFLGMVMVSFDDRRMVQAIEHPTMAPWAGA